MVKPLAGLQRDSVLKGFLKEVVLRAVFVPFAPSW
jgi:hypothetical protein